jgi:hypothetical protein
MKSDEDVRMISAEAPVLFAKVRAQWICVSRPLPRACNAATYGELRLPLESWCSQACEMFILELTLRSWYHAEENKRRTLQRNDIAAAITRTDIFDFLVRAHSGCMVCRVLATTQAAALQCCAFTMQHNIPCVITTTVSSGCIMIQARPACRRSTLCHATT